jgi:hypothetical protein
MKKQIISAFSKFTLGVLLITSVAAVQAQSPAHEPGENEKSAIIKYLGAQDDMMLFKVSYKNPTGEKFSVLVKDQDGSLLFQSAYTDKTFDKKFKLPRTDKNKISFVIRNYKDADIAKNFEINVNSLFIEDVAVKRVN